MREDYYKYIVASRHPVRVQPLTIVELGVCMLEVGDVTGLFIKLVKSTTFAKKVLHSEMAVMTRWSVITIL